jgi:hypothetical protein
LREGYSAILKGVKAASLVAAVDTTNEMLADSLDIWQSGKGFSPCCFLLTAAIISSPVRR